MLQLMFSTQKSTKVFANPSYQIEMTVNIIIAEYVEKILQNLAFKRKTV